MTTKGKPKARSLGYGQGAVAQLPSGAWRWQGPVNGERVSITKPTEREAIDAGARAQAEGAKPADGMTVAELLDGWVASRAMPGARAKTCINDATSAVAISKLIGRVRVEDLTVRVVEDQLLAPLVAMGRSTGTIAKVRSALNMACKRAVRRGDMATNPVRDAETPKGAARPRAKRFFRRDEVGPVVEYLTTNHTARHALFLTMMWCGLRPEEARGLLWKAIDFDAGTLRVDTAAEADGTIHGVLKTDHHGGREAHRTVPMMPELIAVLRREREEQLARCGRRPHVFAENNGAVLTDAVMDPAATEIARNADVRFVNPNGYRHTYASMLMDAGLSQADIMRLCGWRTSAMLTNYTHAMTDVPDAVGALRRAMGGN